MRSSRKPPPNAIGRRRDQRKASGTLSDPAGRLRFGILYGPASGDQFMKSGISRRTFIRSGGALAGPTAAALAQYRTDKSLDYAPPGDDRFQERMWKGAPEEGFALTRALECPGGSLHINA